MATYSNQHWLLSHIRNSFISTDDTGMCETVMVSDDLPKHFLRKFQAANTTPLINAQQQQRKSNGMNGTAGGNNNKNLHRNVDQPLQEVDFVCYPGLDQSDEEDIDLSTQSFDIQMYPEVGAHRFRSNTAQKLEKMDIARRKAARTKCVNYDDDIIGAERNDLFVRKEVVVQQQHPVEDKSKSDWGAKDGNENTQDNQLQIKLDRSSTGLLVKSKLSLQLASSPKQTQNKFMEYARFDGTSQTGMQTKRINVFLSMLPEKERNYPLKICVVASAKILEVIGLVCYKATIQFPAIPLKSIRHYALYMTEDNDDMEDFPPLDNREPCSKFGFSHLTLAERRPLAPVTRIDYHQNNNSSNNMTTKSMTSEDDKVRFAASTTLQGFDLNGSNMDADVNNSNNDADSLLVNYEERMLSHNEMLEAPMYRIYRLQMIDKRFFKTEVTLGISGERMEIDQHKNAKFWTKQKAVTHSIDAIAFCEIVERRNLKAVLRIWLRSSSSSASSSSAAANAALLAEAKSSTLTTVGSVNVSSNVGPPHSPTSPGHYQTLASPFSFFTSSSSAPTSAHTHHIRFKHYDFEADLHTADHILNKLNCILDVRSSEVRREFLLMRERKLEKSQAKKQLKVF